MKNISLDRLWSSRSSSRVLATGVWSALAAVLLTTESAQAHHPFGGETPTTFFQGFLSGLGHPVIGFDHLAFVIAVGLLAAVLRRGIWVPVAFVLATLVGTGVHLAELNLPEPELVITTSVLLFGALAVMRDRLNAVVVILLAAIAGVFHGYAYGEAIVGAEATPLLAYLIGFAGAQGVISYLSYFLAQRGLNQDRTAGLISVRHAGFAILGAGAAFFGGLVA